MFISWRILPHYSTKARIWNIIITYFEIKNINFLLITYGHTVYNITLTLKSILAHISEVIYCHILLQAKRGFNADFSQKEKKWQEIYISTFFLEIHLLCVCLCVCICVFIGVCVLVYVCVCNLVMKLLYLQKPQMFDAQIFILDTFW